MNAERNAGNVRCIPSMEQTEQDSIGKQDGQVIEGIEENGRINKGREAINEAPR